MEYTLFLDGKKEFYPKLNNKKYNILLVDTEKKINFMIKYLEDFINLQNQNINKKFYLGMDYEFNRVRKGNRDIALFQINLENDITNIGTIFVFYPPELNNKQEIILINLLTNKYIIKILHGGESLDIPYLFNQVLKTQENINLFCQNFYDTKYLCEYSHIENNITKKCSIYYLLEEYNIITHDTYLELESIEDKTGPMYLIHIDIHNINFDVFRYSLYDVLYLPQLIKAFLKKSDIYKFIIPEITQYINQYKRLSEHPFNLLKKNIDKYNINFIYLNKISYPLNDIFQYYLIMIIDPIWNNLYKITYFKEFLTTITKYLVFKFIFTNNDVWINSRNKAQPINTYIIKNFKHINIFIQKINNIIKVI